MTLARMTAGLWGETGKLRKLADQDRRSLSNNVRLLLERHAAEMANKRKSK